MFDGLAYLHAQNHVHRDMKGANLLIDKKAVLKIADFGLARELFENGDFPYTNRVVTLWYRSPELLCDEVLYRFGPDLWRGGCILAGMFSKAALFQGKTEVEQMETTISRLGTCDRHGYERMKDLAWTKMLVPNRKAERRLEDFLRDPNLPISMPKSCQQLVIDLLSWHPESRPSAQACLDHPYYSESPEPSPIGE
ncbi:kinase subunit of RNA polymerase II carboxy-terminal domain kinase I [Borealophlyctis nickersoniae]|nr:kinase subunit of RNA polymerase II carboxy-terminal domain kinase I [Borealophlyctis nickersoniae]